MHGKFYQQDKGGFFCSNKKDRGENAPDKRIIGGAQPDKEGFAVPSFGNKDACGLDGDNLQDTDCHIAEAAVWEYVDL